MKHLRIGLACLAVTGLTLGVASTASARNVCVTVNSGQQLVLQKGKLPRAGKAIALVGYNASNGAPLHGAARTKADGSSTRIDVVLGSQAFYSGATRFGWTSTGGSFTGVGLEDDDGDNVGDIGRTFTVVDCATYPVP